MQKYELSRQTLKMTIVLWLQLYKILLYIARIGYENTYDMRVVFDFKIYIKKSTAVVSRKLTNYWPPFENQDILIFVL